MKRRGFFAAVAAVLAAPKAVKLLPLDAMPPPPDLRLRGLAAWLPDPETFPLNGDDFVMRWPPLPMTVDGRLAAALDMLDDGIIDRETFAKLVESA